MAESRHFVGMPRSLLFIVHTCIYSTRFSTQKMIPVTIKMKSAAYVDCWWLSYNTVTYSEAIRSYIFPMKFLASTYATYYTYNHSCYYSGTSEWMTLWEQSFCPLFGDCPLVGGSSQYNSCMKDRCGFLFVRYKRHCCTELVSWEYAACPLSRIEKCLLVGGWLNISSVVISIGATVSVHYTGLSARGRVCYGRFHCIP